MGTFFSKKKVYGKIDQSYLLNNLDDIKIDIENKNTFSAKDFNHVILHLEDQIKELKEMHNTHTKEIIQLQQQHTAICTDLRRLLTNDNILDQRINELEKPKTQTVSHYQHST